MRARRSGLIGTGLFFFLCWPGLAVEWHHPLTRDGGGLWRQRIAITVANPTDQAVEGVPVRVALGAGGISLTGTADAVRVCNSRGQELLFALVDNQGLPVTQGPVPASGYLTIPVECAARQTAISYIYFDNPSAGELADFLTDHTTLINGDLESGAGATPAGWKQDMSDATHSVAWTGENPQSGKRCLKTVVAAGADPTWISTRQEGLRIQGGARYVMTAWVRARDVEGEAGWYIHLGSSDNPMLISPMLNAGRGTFEWKKVSAGFTAPASADRADLGTVLRGTGTAWFDHVTLECLDAVSTVKATPGPVERLDLKQVGTRPPWPEAPLHRAEVKIINLSRDHSSQAEACLELSTLEGRTRGPLDRSSLRLNFNGNPIPHAFLGDRLLFPVNLPPRTGWTCYLDFTGESSGSANKQRGHTAGVLRGNLVHNPGIESGTQEPAHWTNSGASAGDGVTFGVDDPHRTDLGRRSLRMHVPATAPSAWRGWQQDVPIRPGHTYLLAAEVKCQNIPSGEVLVHVHFRKADGNLCLQNAMTSVGPGLHGTTDWTLVSGTLTAPVDAARLQIHLTMNQSGTVWHDAVAVVEVVPPSSVRHLRRPDAGQNVQVWQVPAMIKVFPDTAPPEQITPVGIAAARNEREPLQLAISSGKARKGVRLVADPPVGPTGAALTDLEVAVVGFVPVDYPTGYYQSKSPAWYRKVPESAGQSDGWPGLWPDPLLPRDHFDLAAGSTQPIWITVHVGKDAPAGDYRGTVRLVCDQEVLATVPYTVHVWNFAIPEHSRFKAIYDISLGPGGEALWNETHEQAYPQIARAMAARRTCPNRILPDPTFRYENGRASADFSAFDRAARVYFDEWKFPHAYMPDLFYLFGWGFPPKDVFGENPFAGRPPFENADRTVLRAEYKRAYQACLKLFWEHVKAKGWQDRFVLYISDEPFYQQERIRQQMKALCTMIHEVDRAIPIYSSTWQHVPDWDGSLDIWGLGMYGDVPVKKLEEIRAGGAKLWFTTDGHMCIDTPYCAIERLLPHFAFHYGAEAYEFWGIAWLTHDPYRFGWHAYIPQTDQPGQSYWIRYPNGDGFLLYPGGPIGASDPVSTVRLEQAREGVEDYEYLQLLRRLVDREHAAHRECAAAEQALAQAARLVPIPNAGGRYSTKILPDPEAVYRVRKVVAEAIEGLSSR